MAASAGGPQGSSSHTENARAFVERLLHDEESRECFEKSALTGLTLKEASPGRVVCTIKADPGRQNLYGTLHGGCIATLVDTVSTCALVTTSPSMGMSVNLAVTYLRAVPGGEEVTIEARVLHAGRQLATIEVDILAGGKLCARGMHTKAMQVAAPGSKPRSKL